MQNITTTTALGATLRKRRKQLGLTQFEAAGLCGVGERFLRELEHGKPTVEFGKTLQVIRGLGLKLQMVGFDVE